MAKRPHIVILNPDEMRYDTMGHSGNAAASTPVLDGLAQNEAVSFSRAYCQNPVCVPSRCSFLTGLYPHVRGHRTMTHLLRQGEDSLFSELKRAGYYVWLNGRNDFVAGQITGLEAMHADEIFYYDKDSKPSPGGQSRPKMQEPPYEYSHFHGVLSDEFHDPDWDDTNEAIKKIKNAGNMDKPLCLFLGWLNPHPPYQVEKKYYDRIDPDQIEEALSPRDQENKSLMVRRLQELSGLENWDEEKFKEMRRVYLAQCAKVDDMAGAVVDALKEAGIYDDTAIFFLSDHGDFAGDFHLAEKAQNSFEDCLTRVPFLIKPPKGYGEVDAGTSTSPVELVDFYATVMDMAGVEPSHTHFGKSLGPVLSDRSVKVREFACSEGGRNPGETHCDEWHADGPKGPREGTDYWAKKTAQKDDEAHEKATMITDGRFKFVYRASGNHELYDLEKDPEELKNIFGKELAEISDAMKEKLLSWYQRTCDIVPYDYDSRFSEDKLWGIIRNMVPLEMEDMIRQYIRDEKPDIVSAIMYANKKRMEMGL